MAARPFEQVLDEIEQARIGPLQVFEHEHDRRGVRQALEEEPPGREQLLPVGVLGLSGAEQLCERGLDEPALLLIQQLFAQRCAELLERDGRLVVLGDLAAHPHHVRERPVRHALSVGQAPAAMPVDDLGDPVEVLVELPGEPRLADSSDAGDRDEMRLALLGAGMEELLQLPQLALAADKRRFETVRCHLASPRGHDPLRAPERHAFLLALQLVLTGRLVGDHLLGGSACGVADEDGPGLGNRLYT